MYQISEKKNFHNFSDKPNIQVCDKIKVEPPSEKQNSKVSMELDNDARDSICKKNLIPGKFDSKAKKLKKKINQYIGSPICTKTLNVQANQDGTDLNNNVNTKDVTGTTDAKKEVIDNIRGTVKTEHKELYVKDANSNIVTDCIRKVGKRKSDDVGTGTGKVVKRDVERQVGNEELASDVKPLVFDVYVKQEGESTFYCTLCNSHVARPVLPLHINGWKHNYLKQSKIKEEKENDVADKPLNTNVQGDIKDETNLFINKPIQTKVSAQGENRNKNIRKYSRYVLLQLRDNRASKCIPPGLDKDYFVDGVWSATEYKNRSSSKTSQTIANTSPKPNQANEEPGFNVDKSRKRPAEPCNGSSQEDSLQWKRRRYDEEGNSTSQQRKSYYEGHKENKESDNRHKTSSIRSLYTSRHYSSTRNHQSTRHYHYSRSQSTRHHQSTRHYDKNRTSYSDKPYSFHNFIPYNKLQHSWQPRTEPSSSSSLTKNDARENKDFPPKSFGSSSTTVNNETASKNKDVKASIDSKKGFEVREKSSAIGNFKDTEKMADKKETQDKCTNSVQVLSTELECLAGGTANKDNNLSKVYGKQSAKIQSQGDSKKSAKELREEDRTKYAKEISTQDDNKFATELFCESTILNLKTPKESKDVYASFLKSIIPQQLNTSVAVDTDTRADDEIIVIESDKENDEKSGNKHGFCRSKADVNDLGISSLRREEHDAEITVKEEPLDDDVVDKSQVAMNLSTNLENMAGRDKTADALPNGNGPSSEKKSEKEIILKDFYNRCQNSLPDSRKRPAESCKEKEITRDSSETIQGKSGALWKQNSQTKECVDVVSKLNEGMNKKSQEPVGSNEKLPVTNVEDLNEKEVAEPIFEDGAELGKAVKLPFTNVEAVSGRIDERKNVIAIGKDQTSDNEVAQEMNTIDGSTKETEGEGKLAKGAEKTQITKNTKEVQITNSLKEGTKSRSETGEGQTTDKTEMKGHKTNVTNERQIRNKTMDGGKSANNSDENGNSANNARGEDKPKTETKTGQIDNTGKAVETTHKSEKGQKPNNNMEEGANDKEETDKSTNNTNGRQPENNTLKTDTSTSNGKEGLTANDNVEEQTANQTKEEQAINNTVEGQTGNNIEEKEDLTNDTREEGNSTNITKEVQTNNNIVEEGQTANDTEEESKSTNGTKEGPTANNTDDQGNSINSTMEKQTSDTTVEEQTTNNEVVAIDLEVPEASNVSVPSGNAHYESNDNVVVIDLENSTEVVIIDLDKHDEEIFNGKHGGKLNNKRRGSIKKRFTDKEPIVIDNDDDLETKNSEIKKLKKDVATLYCPVCKIHVDSDLWTGHMRGKRHRLNKQKRLESKHCKDLYKICIDQMRKQIHRKKKERRNKQKVKSSECSKDNRKNKSSSIQGSEIQDNSCSTHENAMQKRCSKQEGLRKTTVENIVKPDEDSVILIDSEHEEETQKIGTLGQSHDTDSNVARQRSCCSGFSNNTNRGHCVGEGCNVQSSGTFRQEGLQIPDHSCQGIHYDCNFSAGFDGVIERIEFLHNKPCSIAVIIRVPEHDYPSVLPSINYSEMLVNPDCYNLKQIQWETGCYIELKYHQSEENESTVTSQRRRKRNPYILVKSYQHAEQAFACISVAIRKIKELMNTIKKGAGVTDPAHHPAYYYGYRRNKYGVKYR